jgi:uncharacterized protein HemX
MSYVAVAAVAAAVIGAGVSYYNGQQQVSAQKSAAETARQNAAKQAALAEQELNAANKKRADTSGILSAAQQAGKSGASGTMLTGPSGAGPLTLGKSTLLGGGG